MASREDRRRGVLAAIDRVASAGEPADALERATGLLYETFERYGWVGM
jgi:hypothetical protein